MEELISTFHIDWKIMLAQLFNFALVFIALYFIAAKPLSKLMKDRTEEITKGLDDAKKNSEKLQATTAEYESTMQKARTDSNAYFEKRKQEAEAKYAEIIAKADMEMQAKIEQGKKVLEADKNKMIAEAKNELAGLVISATEKVVGKENSQNK